MTAFAIIGFGEVGSIFARDLHAAGVSRLLAYDSAEAACARAVACGYVEVRNTAAEAAACADVVFVSVTAGSTVEAAASLAGGLGRAPFVVHVNSVSPTTKQEAARIVGQAGGRYVEAAVMTGVPPRGLRSPMLLGGPSAPAFAELAARYDITTECMLSARHYGVEDEVLRSLADTLPHDDWPGLARYVMSRALLHGRRRAEE